MMPLYVQLSLEDLAQCLNMSALFGYIFTNDTNFIEQVGSGTLDGIRLRRLLSASESLLIILIPFSCRDISIFTRHYGIPVIMYYAGFVSVDM